MTLDPPRLKDSAELPRELEDAFAALRAVPGDGARVARVAARLGSLLDAPPPPPPPPPSLPRMGPHTLKALRLFAAGVAVGATVMWLTRWQPHANEPAAARPMSSAQVPAATQAPTLVVPAPVAEVPVSAGEPEPAHPPRSAPERSTPRGAARDRHPAPGATVAGSSRAGQAGSARPATQDTSAIARTQETAATQQARADQASADAAVPVAPPSAPKSEIELLFEARTLRQRAPRQALALLDEHAQRFGEGMLAPEREAMAIEILHGLDQTAQAAERLTRYRARYPHSLHLPRLEKMR